MNQLTTIAALPMGGGYLSAMEPEKNEPVTVQMKAAYFAGPDELEFPPIDTDEEGLELGRKYLAACLATA